MAPRSEGGEQNPKAETQILFLIDYQMLMFFFLRFLKILELPPLQHDPPMLLRHRDTIFLKEEARRLSFSLIIKL